MLRRLRQKINFLAKPLAIADQSQSDEKKQLKQHYILGDLHGNLLKLLRYLASIGIFTLSSDHSWEQLVKLLSGFNRKGPTTQKEYIKKLKEILEKATWRKDIGTVQLIGDVLSDAGGDIGNDILTLLALKEIKKKINVRINYSNHDNAFFYNYFQAIPQFLFSSIYPINTQLELGRLIDEKLITTDKKTALNEAIDLTDLVEDYMQGIEAIHYVYDEQNKQLVIGMHAPNGLETIQALARLYNIPCKDIKALSAEALKTTIDEINYHIALDLTSGRLISRIEEEIAECESNYSDVPIEFPLVRLIWNRVSREAEKRQIIAPEKLADGTLLVLVHGHEGPKNNLFKNMLNLDTYTGKATIYPGEELSLKTSGEMSPLPEIKPNLKARLMAIRPLNDILINRTCSSELARALNELFDFIEKEEINTEALSRLVVFMDQVWRGSVTGDHAEFNTFCNATQNETLKLKAEAVWTLLHKESILRNDIKVLQGKISSMDDNDIRKNVAQSIVKDIQDKKLIQNPLVKNLLNFISNDIDAPHKSFDRYLSIVNRLSIPLKRDFNFTTKQIEVFNYNVRMFADQNRFLALKNEYDKIKVKEEKETYKAKAHKMYSFLEEYAKTNHPGPLLQLMIKSIKGPINFALYKKSKEIITEIKPIKEFKIALRNALLDQWFHEKMARYPQLKSFDTEGIPFSSCLPINKKDLWCDFFNNLDQIQHGHFSNVQKIEEICATEHRMRPFFDFLKYEACINMAVAEITRMQEYLSGDKQDEIDAINVFLENLKKRQQGLTADELRQLAFDAMDEVQNISEEQGLSIDPGYTTWAEDFFEERVDFLRTSVKPVSTPVTGATPFTHFILDDLDGDVLKLIRHLIEQGILKLSRTSDYTDLARICRLLNENQHSELDLKEFRRILDAANWLSKPMRLHVANHLLSGQEADRLILYIFNKLSTNKIDFTTGCPLYDTFILDEYTQTHWEFYLNSTSLPENDGPYGQSSYLNQLFDMQYLSHLKAIDYVYDPEQKPPYFAINFHGADSLEMIRALAISYKIVPAEQELTTLTALELKKIIDIINIKFIEEIRNGRLKARVYAEKEASEEKKEASISEFPFLRLLKGPPVVRPDRSSLVVPQVLQDGTVIRLPTKFSSLKTSRPPVSDEEKKPKDEQQRYRKKLRAIRVLNQARAVADNNYAKALDELLDIIEKAGPLDQYKLLVFLAIESQEEEISEISEYKPEYEFNKNLMGLSEEVQTAAKNYWEQLKLLTDQRRQAIVEFRKSIPTEIKGNESLLPLAIYLEIVQTENPSLRNDAQPLDDEDEIKMAKEGKPVFRARYDYLDDTPVLGNISQDLPLIRDLLIIITKYHGSHKMTQAEAELYKSWLLQIEPLDRHLYDLASNIIEEGASHHQEEVPTVLAPESKLLSIIISELEHMREEAIKMQQFRAIIPLDRLIKKAKSEPKDINSLIENLKNNIVLIAEKYSIDISLYQRTMLEIALNELDSEIQKNPDNPFNGPAEFVLNFIQVEQPYVPDKDLNNVINLVNKTTQIVKTQYYDDKSFQQALKKVGHIETSDYRPWSLALAGVGGFFCLAGIACGIGLLVGASILSFGIAPMAMAAIYLAVAVIGSKMVYKGASNRKFTDIMAPTFFSKWKKPANGPIAGEPSNGPLPDQKKIKTK